MIPLPKELSKNGYTYYLKQRSEHGYIYEQIFNGKTVGYEVFRHRESKEYEIGGNTIPARVQFPGNEDFGKTAWVFKTFERAFEKFKTLEKKEDESTQAKP